MPGRVFASRIRARTVRQHGMTVLNLSSPWQESNTATKRNKDVVKGAAIHSVVYCAHRSLLVDNGAAYAANDGLGYPRATLLLEDESLQC